ncbi:MAG: hypothetical protein LBP98_06635 [Tannerella sp.]|nr:hypothetical protein [Tannerella sp.]
MSNKIQRGGPYLLADSVPVGYLNVYLIANERSAWNLDDIKKGVTQESELKEIKYNYSTDPDYKTKLPEAHPDQSIPMFGEKKNVYIDITKPNNKSEVVVKRIFAKVTLQLECIFADSTQHNGGEALALDTVRLWRIPKNSRLVEVERYTDPTFWFNDATTADFRPFRPNPNPVPAGWPVSLTAYKELPASPGYPARFLDTINFYIPEYLPDDTTFYTYVSIKVGIKTQPHISKTYKLILGEGLVHGSKFMRGDSILPNGHQRDILDLSIQRNTHYDIQAKIKNFGLTGNEDMDVYLKVENWVEANLDSLDVVDYTLNISQSQFTIPLNHEAVVYIETNHPEGWSANVDPSSNFSLNGSSGVTSLSRQDSGPLKFKATATGTYHINVIVGKVTKQIKVIVT